MQRTIIAVSGLILLAKLVLLAPPAAANNIAVTRVALVNQDVAGKTMDVKFDLSWSNSWRANTPACTNWDAAWVFVKFRPQGSNDWEHAKLSMVNSEHTAPGGGTINVGGDGTNGMGVFIYSASVQTGTVAYTGTRLRWKSGSNGYSFAKGAAIEVSVQAIEMVYVAEGSFRVGSGGTESGSFTEGPWTSGPTIPFEITGAWDRQITNTAGKLWGGSTIGVGTLNASFPIGYNAFYCMKYEITQGQYRDFLNMLTRAQQNNRTGSQVASNFAMSASATIYLRNGIRCPAVIPGAPTNIIFGCDGNANMVFDETSDAMDRACNQMLWYDVTAYADWAGLRPMTELEFEKACRGPSTPVANEYAWGNTTKTDLTGYSGTDGSGTETALPTTANFFSGPGGPARVGIYATNNSSRVSAGASYWGIMELGGNMGEDAVTAGSATGRSFTGLHGDGKLATTGDPDVTGWPNTDGALVRCYGWYSATANGCVSVRDSNGYGLTSRASYGGGVIQGGRAVRTAP